TSSCVITVRRFDRAAMGDRRQAAERTVTEVAGPDRPQWARSAALTGPWLLRRHNRRPVEPFRSPMLPLRVTLISLLVAASTLLHVVPLLAVAIIKALLPFKRLRKASNPVLTGLAESWIGVNNWVLDRFLGTRIDVQQDVALQQDGHYLVLANHQSWVDIVVLQKVFNRRIPL